MKIVWLLSWYPNKHNPMSGIFLKEQSALLADQTELRIVYIEQVSPKDIVEYLFGKKFFKYTSNHITIYHKRILSLERVSPRLAAENFKRAFLKLYDAHLRQEKPDILHAHVTMPAGYAACKAGQKYSVPVLITEHASFFESFFQRNAKKCAAYALGSATGYIAVSSVLKKQIGLHGRKDCALIPNFIHERPVKNGGRNTGSFQIVHVSLFSANKRIDLILDALKILISSDQSGWRLVLAGDGPCKRQMERRADELGIRDSVTFTGLMDNEAVGTVIAASDVLVIASDTETFGVTGIEAMMAGTPVVATRCGGPEDYVNSHTGLLVDKNNARQLAEAILRVRNTNYDKQQIHDFAVGRYGAKAVTEKLVEYYGEVARDAFGKSS